MGYLSERLPRSEGIDFEDHPIDFIVERRA